MVYINLDKKVDTKKLVSKYKGKNLCSCFYRQNKKWRN